MNNGPENTQHDAGHRPGDRANISPALQRLILSRVHPLKIVQWEDLEKYADPQPAQFKVDEYGFPITHRLLYEFNAGDVFNISKTRDGNVVRVNSCYFDVQDVQLLYSWDASVGAINLTVFERVPDEQHEGVSEQREMG